MRFLLSCNDNNENPYTNLQISIPSNIRNREENRLWEVKLAGDMTTQDRQTEWFTIIRHP
jgi:hypothetical protein